MYSISLVSLQYGISLKDSNERVLDIMGRGTYLDIHIDVDTDEPTSASKFGDEYQIKVSE